MTKVTKPSALRRPQDHPSSPGPRIAPVDITDSVRHMKDFDGHERVYELVDPASGLDAVIVIHDRRLGPALGGCRMWPYGDRAAALEDVLRLSRGMTYKAAVAGLDYGGGKAVIVGDPRRHKTEALLAAFGAMVEHLDGAYLTAEDVGMGVADLDRVARTTAHAFGTSASGGCPSEMTALGVHAALRAAADHRFGSADLAGLTVAVQGLGNVGLALCRRLHADGARLVVADIDADRVRQTQDRFGAEAAPAEAIHRVPADAFAPCALGAVLDAGTVAELKVAMVAGSANNQLATDADGDGLHARGILYAPDYVANAGGLIEITVGQVEGETDRARVEAKVRGIGATLAHIFRRADADGLPPAAVADRLARERVFGGARTAG